MERIACQVRYVFSSKNCVTEEETVGQRGSCSQTHTQDSGLTLKSITSRGKGELSLGELFLGLFLTHGFYITPPPTPLNSFPESSGGLMATSLPSCQTSAQLTCTSGKKHLTCLKLFRQRESTLLLTQPPQHWDSSSYCLTDSFQLRVTCPPSH